MDISVTIVPRYNCNKKVVSYLERIASEIKTKSIHSDGEITALLAEVPYKKLNDLSSLSDLVDIIAVYSFDRNNLENYSLSITPTDMGINTDVELRIYSPNAKLHTGKMSNGGRSDAEYHWIIVRPEELTKGENPVCLLLQSIKKDGKTSKHCHKKTYEKFLNLAGDVEIKMQTEKREAPINRRIPGNFFLRCRPNTWHQLYSLNGGAVNLLYMNPYDPKLKDHFYLTSLSK